MKASDAVLIILSVLGQLAVIALALGIGYAAGSRPPLSASKPLPLCRCDEGE